MYSCIRLCVRVCLSTCSSDETITALWATLESFSDEEKALFVQFVTGTSKVRWLGGRGWAGLGWAEGVGLGTVPDLGRVVFRYLKFFDGESIPFIRSSVANELSGYVEC